MTEPESEEPETTPLDYQIPSPVNSWDYEIGAILAVLFWGFVGLIVLISTLSIGRQRGPNYGWLAANIAFFLIAAIAWPLSRRKGQKPFLRGLLNGTAVLGMIWGIIFIL